jgi:hypothetical protein
MGHFDMMDPSARRPSTSGLHPLFRKSGKIDAHSGLDDSYGATGAPEETMPSPGVFLHACEEIFTGRESFFTRVKQY